jgi:dihydroorotate dehydrogenase electron transfer subunit
MVFQKSFELISYQKLNDKIFRLGFFAPEIVKNARPGNFVHLRVGDRNSPLLRRAFSIFDLDLKVDRFDILFKVVGPGTEILSRKSTGDSLDLLGPLGNGFEIPKEDESPVLVAGGMGVAPLMSLAFYLVKNRKIEPEKISFLYGERTRSGFVCLEDLRELGIKTHLATEDKSEGFEGMVTELFLRNLKDGSFSKDAPIFSCGPHPMMKTMSELSKKHDLFCQLSLESHMPCGLGACWGCVVKTNGDSSDSNYKRICKDGPIFDAREVELD